MPSDIAKLIASLREYYRTQPDKACAPDSPATAILEDGLRCRVDSGEMSVLTDMPEGVGGGASAPSPGWFLRAAVASCAAAAIAMRAAECGIELDELKVRVESDSDNRGLLGMGDASAALMEARIVVRICAPHASADEIDELVAWADAHSPVGESLRHAVSVRTTLELV